MRVAKTRLDNITTYTYYAAYSVLNDVTAQMLADFNPSRNEFTDIAFIKRFLPFVQSKEVLAGSDFPLFSDETYTMYGCAKAEAYPYTYEDKEWYLPSGTHIDYDSVFSISHGKCVGRSDYDLMINPSKFKRCSGKRKIYRAPFYSLYVYSYRYDNFDPAFNPTEMFANTYSKLDDSCNYTCKNGANNCGYYTEYTDFNCAHPYFFTGGTLGWRYLAFLASDDYLFLPGDKIESDSGDYVQIVNSTMLDGNVCKYEIKCREDTEPYTADLQSYYGVLAGKKNTNCLPKCNYPSWYDFDKHICVGGSCQPPSEGCPSGTVWRGEPTCSCVPEPPTIPRKGINFCNMFVSLANTKAGTMCQGGAVAANTTDFSDITEDIILRNGMKIYNASQNPDSIADLVGNDTGGTVTKTDGTTFDTNIAGYTLYVDIDGSSGNSKLWEDVSPFYVTLSGKVIPAYKTDALGEFGGDSRYYMQTSIQVDAVDSVGATQYWLLKSKSFKESACKAGYVGQNTLYCSRHDVTNPAVTQDTICSQEQNSCSVKKVSPIRGF